jgi:hypothetical protein
LSKRGVAILICSRRSNDCSDSVSISDRIFKSLDDNDTETFPTRIAIRFVIKAVTDAVRRQETHVRQTYTQVQRKYEIASSDDSLIHKSVNVGSFYDDVLTMEL